MAEQNDMPNYQFISLVYSLSQTVMFQMGKIANPVTGKVEKNLAQAKATIDMLEMLQEKTKGNLNPTEEKMILTTLQNLYLNYAEEVKSETGDGSPLRRPADEAGETTAPPSAGGDEETRTEPEEPKKEEIIN